MEKFIYEGYVHLNEHAEKTKRLAYLYNSSQSGRERSWFRSVAQLHSTESNQSMMVHMRAGLLGSNIQFQEDIHSFIMLVAFDPEQEKFLQRGGFSKGIIFNDFNEEIGKVHISSVIDEEKLLNGEETA